ncbi:MAG: flagellar biosynthesis protein FlhB [Gemmatimonadota bacterium]
MAEESYQDKTEKPTPKRRRDAARKGDVPRSQEVTTAFLLLAAAGVLYGLTGGTAGAVADLFGVAVQSFTALPVGPEGTAEYIRALGTRALVGLAPVVLVLAGTALVVTGVQARGILTAEPLKPQWNRLNPLARARQIWGVQAVAGLAKSLFKLLIVSVAVWAVLGTAVEDLPALGQSHPFALLELVRRYAVRMFLSAGLAFLALALADYAYQIWQFERKLRMSREEIRKEVKESEGDQVMKVRRRTMARQLARNRMLQSVAEADVVVTNPTHIAVALKYDPDMADAPLVLAMGERKVAERIKELAREHGVPTVENRPLARALFSTATVGLPIPVDLFVAVAEVLAFVYRLRGSQPGGGRGAR